MFNLNFVNNVLASGIQQSDLKKLLNPIVELCEKLVPELLVVVGALGAVWVIILCVKFAKAEDPQEHEKAKKALINAILGFVLIFVLLIMLNLGIDIFTNWYDSYQV